MNTDTAVQNDRMDTADIAKVIRTDLKAAFPGTKFGVRTRRFAGGSAIDVEVVTATFRINNPAYVAFATANPHDWTDLPRRTEEAKKFLEDVKKVAAKLHRDNSDPMTDYFNCNFYLSVEFDGELVAKDRLETGAWLVRERVRKERDLETAG